MFLIVFPNCFQIMKDGFKYWRLIGFLAKDLKLFFVKWLYILLFIRLEDYYSSNIPYTEANDAIDSDVDECSNPSSIRSS